MTLIIEGDIDPNTAITLIKSTLIIYLGGVFNIYWFLMDLSGSVLEKILSGIKNIYTLVIYTYLYIQITL